MPRIAAVLLLTAAIALQCDGGSAPKDKAAVQPVLREATKFLEVRGTLRGLDVQLEIEYQTTDRDCRVVIDRFAGAYSPRTYHHAVTLKRDGDRYTAKVPLDIVGETTCGWAPFAVNYVATIGGKPMRQPVPPSPLVWFREGAPETLPVIHTECRGRICETEPGEHWLAPDAKSAAFDFAQR
jgi:hypothetical protein